MADLVGVRTVGTDYGHCCLIVPQKALLNRSAETASGNTGGRMSSPEKGSKTGETNGFSVVLDVENFNVGYDRAQSQGARIAIHDYRYGVVSS